uniref:Secreted protein n=1 Tax=Setaria viridis TaxID=4556 RepID=A0A4U6V9G9_SETVI|nr:hypothetical protein SEVIR_3G098650v2 [Setaria viridis]
MLFLFCSSCSLLVLLVRMKGSKKEPYFSRGLDLCGRLGEEGEDAASVGNSRTTQLHTHAWA